MEVKKNSNNKVEKIGSNDIMEILMSQFVGGQDRSGVTRREEGKTTNVLAFLPSQYKKQLSMSCEERLKASGSSNNQGPFGASPRAVIFQQYTAGNNYHAQLVIKNISMIPQCIKIIAEPDLIFQVIHKGQILNNRMAPGTCRVYTVKMSPQEKKDYHYEIIVLTDDSKMKIPIIGLGPRAFLDFPDEIILPETGAKIPTLKILQVRNVGESRAAFTLSSSSKYFLIQPPRGLLDPDENTEFTVKFSSHKAGNYTGFIYLKYETGEMIKIKLQAIAKNSNITIEPSKLKFSDTFIGLSNARAIKITNNSDFIIDFHYMKYKDTETDKIQRKKLTDMYKIVEDIEEKRQVDLEQFDICPLNAHTQICKRILTDELSSLDTEYFLYSSSDCQFTLIPINGKIGPRSCAQINVIFQPRDIGKITSTAYLEVTGREKRIEIIFSGTSRGPILKLDSSVINAEDIYLNSNVSFEINCSNEGLIPGTLIHKLEQEENDKRIVITPSCQEIEPCTTKNFHLDFSSSKTGDFSEKIEFMIKETKEILMILVKGQVKCPTLAFSMDNFNLGTTAVGFTSKYEVSLSNQSPVSVKFRAFVEEDGLEAPVVAEKIFNDLTSGPVTSLPANPCEFFIQPGETTIGKYKSIVLEIYFTPNIVRTGEVNLLIKIQDSEDVSARLRIFFKSCVPIFEIEPQQVNFQNCFINFPYEQTFKVTNSSDVEGVCYFETQETPHTKICYSLARNWWHLQPGESAIVEIKIITREIGRQKMELSVMTFGQDKPQSLGISCCGKGPVVRFDKTQLNWGKVELLQEQLIPIKIINESPISVNFKAIIANKNTPCKILPSSGEIAPSQFLEVTASLYLRDPGKHSDKIIFAIANTSPVAITSNAIGTGSSILFEPEIFPGINMDRLLTKYKNTLTLCIVNEGNKSQRLTFSNKTQPINSQSVPTTSPPPLDVFSIEPASLEVPGRSSKQIILAARSRISRECSEDWCLYGTSEGQGKKQIIATSTFSAFFVEPSVIFDPPELDFFINKGPDIDDNAKKITEELEIINNSKLKLNLYLSVEYPFKILTTRRDDDEKIIRIELEKDEKYFLKINFTPNETEQSFRSRDYEELLKIEYENHPKIDIVKCRASVNFPSINLIPKTLEFNVPVGDCAEEKFMLINDGMIGVYFNLTELEKSRNEKCVSSITLYESNLSEESKNSQEITIDSTTQLFEIYPSEGFIPPHSSQTISCSYRPQKTMYLITELLCEILEGQAEYIKIEARSDFINYLLSESLVIFDKQTIFESDFKIIKFKNKCGIKLKYEIIDTIDNDKNSLIKIEPNYYGEIEPHSTMEFQIISQPIIPGFFINNFKFKLLNIPSVIEITVRGEGIFPQVHIDLPRIWPTINSIEREYLAIQSLSSDDEYYSTSTNDADNEKKEKEKLIENEWDGICERDSLPSLMKINMAIEKFMTKEYIKENKLFIMSCADSKDYSNRPIPYLLSAEYVLDMGNIIIEQSTSRSILVQNHSTCKLSIRMKKVEKKNYLTKYGVFVKLKNNINLLPGEFFMLKITMRLPREVSSEINKKIKRTIYLEVVHGLTIPVTIVAVVASPCLIPSPGFIDFGNVYLGYCKKMSFKLINKGLVDSEWSIKTQSQDLPFNFSPTSGTCCPGESTIIDVFFAPIKSQQINMEFLIDVNQSLNSLNVILVVIACGIEAKVKIMEPRIFFSCGTPYSNHPEEKFFTIKNIDEIPLEFSWRHLDKLSLDEERMTRVFSHYFSTDEIIIPARKIGCQLYPESLYQFYESLINEMLSSAEQEKLFTEEINNEPIVLQNNAAIQSKKIKQVGNVDKILTNDNLSLQIDSPGKTKRQFSIYSQYDSDKIENLLHLYIEKLHPMNFQSNPFDEIFNNEIAEAEKEEEDCDDFLTRKLCIIFHGAPFTEYQETACKTARKLEIPLLNIDNCFIESIALSDLASSLVLRNLIDSKYQELLLLFTSGKFSNSQVLSSFRSDDEYLKENMNYFLHGTGDLIEAFKKIPSIDELNLLDSLSRYEYKIEAIKLLQEIFLKNTGKLVENTARGNVKIANSGKRNIKIENTIKKETFLDVDIAHLAKMLHVGLLKNNLQNGFIIQTLKNSFILNEVTVLSTIIQLLTPINIVSIVTFHNSLETYEYQVELVRNRVMIEKREKMREKLRTIDEMSDSEYQLLPEEDKNLFIEKIQRPRIEEAQLRRQKFYENISALMSPKDRDQSVDSDKNKIETKVNNEEEKLSPLVTPSNIVEAMKTYEDSLASIESWVNSHSENSVNFWHVKFSDPWNSDLYELIISQIVDNVVNNKILLADARKNDDIDDDQGSLEPKFYSIATPCSVKIAKPHHHLFELQDSLENKLPEPRFILQPDEFKSFKIIFKPKKIGSFKNKYILSIVGGNGQYHHIGMTGSSDIPHLDMTPNSLFSNVTRTKIDETNLPTFFIETNTYDFGALFVPEQKKNEEKPVHSKIGMIKLLNPSLIYNDVEFSLENSINNFNGFSLDKTFLSIKSKDIGIIEVTAMAPKLGINTNNLLVTLKNNPRVGVIKLQNFGETFMVNFVDNIVAFGRVLKCQKKNKLVTLRNKSSSPIFWKIKRPEVAHQQIILPKKSGWIRASSDAHVEICFIGMIVGLEEQTLIPVEMFLQESDRIPISTEIIRVTGETYDVNIDVRNAFPIKFRSVQVGTKALGVFTLRNYGQYPLNFALKCDNNIDSDLLEIFSIKKQEFHKQLKKNLLEDLVITPESGLLAPGKILTINVHFTPRIEMNLQEIPMFICNLYEGNEDHTVISKINLTMSILALYPVFNIQPYPELMFGPVTLGNRKILIFNIENTGLFSIYYKITNQLENKKKKNLKTVEMECFKLSRTDGTLDVGKLEEIQVEACPQIEGQIVQNIFVSLTGTGTESIKEKPLKLSLESCIPKIDFNDFDFIFQDSHIVNQLDEFLCTVDEGYTIFSKKNMTLIFENVIVSSSFSFDLRLRNPGLVASDILVDIAPNNSFSIEPERATIQSLETCIFTITFKPTLIQNYFCLLEAKILLKDAQQVSPEKLSIKIIGNSCMPEIVLIEPSLNSSNRRYLDFGPCLIGDTSTLPILFKNVGKVKTKARIEIRENSDADFIYSLKDTSDNNKEINESPERSIIEINSQPGDHTKLMVIFKPKNGGKFEAQVCLFFENNPYEQLTIDLRGEGFLKTVVLKGLSLAREKVPENDDKFKKQLEENNFIYKIEMGSCFVNEWKRLDFKIVNKSSDKYFRFEWDRMDDIFFSPSVGHLGCSDYKTITATFNSFCPVSHIRTLLECKLNEIRLLDNWPQDTTWDDRNSTIDHHGDEPYYEIADEIPGSIKLALSATADYSTYSCSAEEINFKDTLVFQTSECKFTMDNPGPVDLVYKWTIIEKSLSITLSFDSLESTCESSLSSPRDETHDSLIKNKIPFIITPENGSLSSGKTQEFVLKFIPRDVKNYQVNLTCEMENLDPKIDILKIFITGQSLPSFYHLDLPESCGLLANHLDIPEDTKLLEFNVIGVGENHTKIFNLTNLTASAYNFSWIEKKIQQNTREISYFHCKFPRGIVNSEESTKIIFEFFAQDVGIFESLWILTINEQKISVLLIGTVRMPQVACCTGKVSLETTCLGRQVENNIKIINKENMALSFRIVKESFHQAVGAGKLKGFFQVEPSLGILEPNKDKTFRIILKPWQIGDVNFHLRIQVEKMTKPLKVLVAGKVVEIQTHLTYNLDTENNQTQEIITNNKNHITLGKIMIKTPKIITFNLRNIQEFPLNYEWNLGVPRNNFYKISIDKIQGTVPSEERVTFTLRIVAREKKDLKNYPVSLSITGGLQYILTLTALVQSPSIEFSFTRYNFGSCYVNETSMSNQIPLKITNRDETVAIVECKENNLPAHLSINIENISREIPPKGTASVLINFHPTEEKTYNETLTFLINSIIKQKIILTGQGVNYKISLVNSENKFIDFGNVWLDKAVKRKILVVNLERLPVEVEFGIIDKLNEDNNFKNPVNDADKIIKIQPQEKIILHRNKPQELIIKFKPKKRLELFEEKICVKIDKKIIKTLGMIRGKCSAAEFYLNRINISFGKIIKDFLIKEKFELCNTGDVGAKFKWSLENIHGDFNIVPVEGFSSPGQSTVFTASYCPDGQSKKSEIIAILNIEDQKSLSIFLCGEFLEVPIDHNHPMETINFEAPARSKQAKSIDVKNNNSNIADKIHAVLASGECFELKNSLNSSSTNLEIIYSPIIMNRKDTGRLIVQFTEQKIVQIYNLEGQSLPPEPIGKIIREIPAKIKHYESFEVFNWLDKPQYLKPKIKHSSSTSIDDNNLFEFNFLNEGINIPGKSMRHYDATFYSYKQSILNFNILFINNEGEYNYYQVEYKIKKPDIIKTIELSTTARLPVFYELVIDNPLKDKSVTYSGTCQHPDVSVEGIPATLAPNSSDKITVKYCPMLATSKQLIEYLNVNCPELGVFPYELLLTCNSGLCEKVTSISTQLGQQIVFDIVIMNSTKLPAQFTIKIHDNTNFIIKKNKISIPGSEYSTINVIFEPLIIGRISTNLIALSDTAGEINYPIIGYCTEPKPQGPFIIKSNKPLVINFKNIYQDEKIFEYIVEPGELFTIGKSTNRINAKQTIGVTVNFLKDEKRDNQFETSGKLIIYCNEPSLSHIQWVYYLKGLLSDNSVL